jgi:hypothetical protein
VNRIVYIVGAMVVIVALLGFLGEIAVLVHGSAHPVSVGKSAFPLNPGRLTH